jgi:hypothetical protein
MWSSGSYNDKFYKKRLVISIIYTLHSVKKEVINAFEARA